MRCPNKACRNKILQKSDSGQRFRIEGPLELGPEGEVIAKCYWCKTEVRLPLQKSAEFDRPKIFVRTTPAGTRRK